MHIILKSSLIILAIGSTGSFASSYDSRGSFGSMGDMADSSITNDISGSGFSSCDPEVAITEITITQQTETKSFILPKILMTGASLSLAAIGAITIYFRYIE